MTVSRAWMRRTAHRRFALALLLGLLAFPAAAPTHAAGKKFAAVSPAFAPTAAQRAFVDTLERRTFSWFWDTAEPTHRAHARSLAHAVVRERRRDGVRAGRLPGGRRAGLDHPRAGPASARCKTLRFLYRAPQDSASAGSIGYRGFFYHFLNPRDGTRFEHLELSFIDTGLLVAGALFCGEYFDRPDAARARSPRRSPIRSTAAWTGAGCRCARRSCAWAGRPSKGHLPYDTGHYNETTLMLLLAMGSPTHPAERGTWRRYTEGYRWGTFHGQEYLGFAPLFGHQSSHVWIDYRGIRDEYMRAHGIDYFENSRRATLAQRQYAIDNPAGWTGYGALEWGLSACDGPVDGDFVVDGAKRHFQTYWARGASHTEVQDDGTITPNAAAGSIAFAPEVVLPALMAMKAP